MIDTVQGMTPQEIFDKVATHLFTQRTRAVNGLNDCQYRTETGAKCAVGCLIPDELYDPVIESFAVHSSVIRPTLTRIGVDEHVDLLAELQGIHDSRVSWTGGPDRLAEKLAALAHDFGLSIDVLTPELIGETW